MFTRRQEWQVQLHDLGLSGGGGKLVTTVSCLKRALGVGSLLDVAGTHVSGRTVVPPLNQTCTMRTQRTPLYMGARHCCHTYPWLPTPFQRACVRMAPAPHSEVATLHVPLPRPSRPFQDLSCEMIFGQAPPPLEQDPAYSQPCFALQSSVLLGEGRGGPRPAMANLPCPKVDTARREKNQAAAATQEQQQQ